MECGLKKRKIVAIQTSNHTVSFERVAFRFKIFNKQVKQKRIDRFLLEELVLHERKSATFCNGNWLSAQREYQI